MSSAHWDVKKSTNQAISINQPNVHVISLIFGLCVAVCELITYFEYFLPFPATLGCQFGKVQKSGKNYFSG